MIFPSFINYIATAITDFLFKIGLPLGDSYIMIQLFLIIILFFTYLWLICKFCLFLAEKLTTSKSLGILIATTLTIIFYFVLNYFTTKALFSLGLINTIEEVML